MTQKAENMRIYTTYFANIRNLPDNVVPISITLKSPPGWAGAEFKKLAPPYKLLQMYKEAISAKDLDKDKVKDYYQKRYNELVLSKLDSVSVLEELKLIAAECALEEDFDIALVCYETPSDFCHRHLVSYWFNSNGIKCKEYGF